MTGWSDGEVRDGGPPFGQGAFARMPWHGDMERTMLRDGRSSRGSARKQVECCGSSWQECGEHVLLARNLLYAGVTRGKQLMALAG